MKGLVTWVRTNPDIILILIIGLFMRARIILRDDLWYDEAFTGNLMRVNLNEFWSILSADPHPPLYYLLVKGWTWILGVSDLSLRSFSLIFGLLTILVVYYLVKELYKKETAAVASFLVAVNPFLTDYSVEARSYGLYGFLMVLAVYLLVKKRFNWLAAVLPLLILTHYFSLLFLPGILIYYILLNRRVKEKWWAHVLRVVPVLAAIGLVLSMVGAKGLEELDLKWIREGVLTNIPRSITSYSYGIKARLGGEDEINNVNFLFDEHLLGAGVFAVYVLGVVLVILKNKDDFIALRKFLFLLFMTFVPMLLVIGFSWYSGRSLYVERYLLPSAIFFLISLALILTDLLSFEIMGICLLFYVFTLTRIVTPGYYQGMKPLADYFDNYQGEIVFTSPVDYVVGQYYLSGNEVRLYNPERPDLDYTWWPFVYDDAYPQDLLGAIYVSPDSETEWVTGFPSLWRI
jgi:uncharacterized membrane protein